MDTDRADCQTFPEARPGSSLSTVMALARSGRSTGAQGSAMSEPDRRRLPIRREAFGGTIGKTLDGSEPDWDLIAHPAPPAGAPNVLLVLIDDAGFGNPSTFGGPIQTPNYTRLAESGLRYNRFHVTASVLAHEGGPVDGSQQPRGRVRLDR